MGFMKKIRQKLKNKNGISIIMGLTFLLICLIVGTIVLTAATTAATGYAPQEWDEQAYLAVSSAARLIKDELDGVAEVTIEYKEDVADPGNFYDASVNVDSPILKTELGNVYKVHDDGTPDPQVGITEEFSIEPDTLEYLEVVWGNMRIDSSNHIIIDPVLFMQI